VSNSTHENVMSIKEFFSEKGSMKNGFLMKIKVTIAQVNFLISNGGMNEKFGHRITQLKCNGEKFWQSRAIV
jgi:hypothetical protein